VSVELYDLGQRLRAATSGVPVPRALYGPLAALDPVAVTLAPACDGLRVRAATTHGTATTQGSSPHALLGALAAVGVTAGPEHRTLVVADQRTVAALAALARQVAPGATLAEQAAVVSWWDQRADHPGTGAVLPVASACASRWAIGTAPDAERDIATWWRWLACDPTDPDDPAALLALAEQVTAGEPLPGLGTLREADHRSWDYHLTRLGRGWDWRWPDDRAEAALGLATREDATELYASLRLTDPLQAVRETYAGNVITGTVTDCPAPGPLQIESDQPVCRLRPDTGIEGWRGGPADVPQPWHTDTVRIIGDLEQVTVTAQQTLTLSITARRNTLAVGDMITLRAAPADPQHQRRGRTQMRVSYNVRGNWLARGARPVARRREVPLDVVVAAADDD
jgi:hypothetical protein